MATPKSNRLSHPLGSLSSLYISDQPHFRQRSVTGSHWAHWAPPICWHDKHWPSAAVQAGAGGAGGMTCGHRTSEPLHGSAAPPHGAVLRSGCHMQQSSRSRVLIRLVPQVVHLTTPALASRAQVRQLEGQGAHFPAAPTYALRVEQVRQVFAATLQLVHPESHRPARRAQLTHWPKVGLAAARGRGRQQRWAAHSSTAQLHAGHGMAVLAMAHTCNTAGQPAHQTPVAQNGQCKLLTRVVVH